MFAYDTYLGSTPDLYTWNDMNEPSVFNGAFACTEPKGRGNLHAHATAHTRAHIHVRTERPRVRRRVLSYARPYLFTCRCRRHCCFAIRPRTRVCMALVDIQDPRCRCTSNRLTCRAWSTESGTTCASRRVALRRVAAHHTHIHAWPHSLMRLLRGSIHAAHVDRLQRLQRRLDAQTRAACMFNALTHMNAHTDATVNEHVHELNCDVSGTACTSTTPRSLGTWHATDRRTRNDHLCSPERTLLGRNASVRCGRATTRRSGGTWPSPRPCFSHR